MTREYTDLAVKRAQVYLVDHGHALLAAFPVEAHDYAARALQRKGVQLRLGMGVKEVTPDHVLLSDGTSIQTRTVIWAGGLMAVPSGRQFRAAARARRTDRSASRTSPSKASLAFTCWATSRTFPARTSESAAATGFSCAAVRACGLRRTSWPKIAGEVSNRVPLSRQGNHGDDRARRGRGGDRKEAA